ncbi:MAG: Na(+)-translocating NADH-quinone reductase subunit A [Flavobacteriales bacterium]
MSKTVKIRKGANIKLVGKAEHTTTQAEMPSSFAIKPTDFHGMIPKMMLKEGAEVKAGTPIFHDKQDERVRYVSPVSGEIAEIVRGAKRKILEVRIVADKDQKAIEGSPVDVSSMNGAQVADVLMNAGLWPFIKKRPYDVVASPNDAPKSIFISGMDSAPLGVDYAYLLEGRESHFQKGIDALAKMTSGKVHLNLSADDKSFLANTKNAQINRFSGPHPAGVVGIQIHHIDPINKGEVVWTVGPQAVAIIGRYLATGKADFSKTVALVGSEVKNPQYIKTHTGAAQKAVTAGRVNDGDNRIISGNVLSGTQLSAEGYLGFYDDMVSVLPEGREPQFMGWLAPNFNKFSLSHAYFSWLMPGKKYALNTSMNGEDRPFVMSGQYEDLLPMDIYPVHLIKSIMTNDIEKMEALGIYEIAPEDMALCEYACTSKVEVQKLIRQGLDTAMVELG